MARIGAWVLTAVAATSVCAQSLSATEPVLQATFSPSSVRPGEPSLLRITFSSPEQLGGTLFISGEMNLGALALFDPGQSGQPLSSDCSVDGNFSAVQSASGLTLSVPFASVGFGQQCSVTLEVTSSQAGSFPAPATLPVFEGSFLVEAPAQFLILGGVLDVVDAPRISLDPRFLDLGFQVVGNRSLPQSIVVSNAGNLPLLVWSMSISSDFAFSTDCVGVQLAPMQKCNAFVTFSPLRTGFLIGQLAVSSNDPLEPVATVTLWGRGFPAPSALAVSPTNLEFPDTFVGSESGPLVVGLSNRSASTVELLNAGVDNPAFRLLNECPARLSPGQSCQMLIRFTPQSEGLASGNLRFDTNPANAAEPVRVSGLGIAPPARVRLIPGQATFVEQLVATTSEEALFQLVNEGSRTATVTRVYATGDFAVSSLGACTELPPGASCSVGVRFTPTQAGSRAGTLVADVVRADQPVSAQLIGLGQDVPTPRLLLSATAVGFGNAWVGSRRITSVVLQNPGTGPLLLRSISVNAPFAVSSAGCPALLAPRAQCVLDVSFEPNLRGSFRGSAIIESDSLAGPANIELSGSGCSLAVTGRGAPVGC